MKNRFSQVKSKSFTGSAPSHNNVSHRETDLKGKPKQQRIGREAYDTLMSLLSEAAETPSTPYGVLIDNSTKRNLRRQIEEIFTP